MKIGLESGFEKLKLGNREVGKSMLHDKKKLWSRLNDLTSNLTI